MTILGTSPIPIPSETSAMTASLPSVSAAIRGFTLRLFVQSSNRCRASPVFGRTRGTVEIISCGLTFVSAELKKFSDELAAKTRGLLQTEIKSKNAEVSKGIAATAKSARPSFTASSARAGSPVSTER